MLKFLKSLWDNRFVVFTVGVVGLAGLWLAYAMGVQSCEVKNLEQKIENVKVKNEVVQSIGRLPADDRRKRLLKWAVD